MRAIKVQTPGLQINANCKNATRSGWEKYIKNFGRRSSS